jgi:hypothetical protein
MMKKKKFLPDLIWIFCPERKMLWYDIVEGENLQLLN